MPSGSFLLYVLFLQINVVIAPTPCITNQEVGMSTPADMSNANKEENEVGLAILTEYSFTCCGFISFWRYLADDSFSNGTFDAQVWRQDGTSNFYTLIGKDTITPTDFGSVDEDTVSNGQRIRTNNGDLIGIHSTGDFLIKYKNGGSTNPARLTSQTSSMATSSSIDWSAATSTQSGDYAIMANVVPSIAPSISSVSDVTFYNDEVSIGNVVQSVTTSDSDLEDVSDPTIIIKTITNSGSTYFELLTESSNANVSVKAVPMIGSYNCTLEAADSCGQTSQQSFVITVQNRPPTIYNLPDSISISEDITDSTIFSIQANDTVTDPLPCSMNTGDTSKFEVKQISPSTTYVVYVKTGVTLDYDAKSVYSVTVRCDDGDGDSVDAILTVNLIKNEPPEIANLPNATSISEDLATRTLIYTLNVTDVDVSDVHTCTLETHTDLFEIDKSAGENEVYLTGGTTLNSDVTTSFILQINCSDHRRGTIDYLTVVLIPNEPPEIANLPNTTSISEDLATRTLIYTLNVTDVDVSDVHTCTLETHTDLFEIDKSAGENEVYLTGGTTLNSDVTASFILQINCSDHRRGTIDYLTVVLIPNEAPSIINLPMSSEILESTTTEILLFTLSVKDAENDTITCSFTQSTSLFYLQIGTNDNEYDIYTSSNQNFDYSVQRSYTLENVCADQRRNDTGDFYVYIMRNMPPKFSNLQGQTTLSAVTSTAGQTVFTVIATDPENDQLEFNVSSSSANIPFIINQYTGEITLSRSINTEYVSGYDLIVYVSDDRNTVGPSTLTVRITDINSPPKLTNLPKTISILESITTGSTIFTPMVDDKNPADTHTYSVIYSPPEGVIYFGINSTDGRIITLGTMDYETIPYQTFSLTLTVTDSYMEDNGTLTVNILNVNEAPKFTKQAYSLSVSEGNAGTVLQDPYYQYSDEDGDNVTFTHDCGSETGRLDIDKTTGFFSFPITYDIDEDGTTTNIQCQVNISDAEYTDTAYVNITVNGENDNTPIFQHSDYTFFAGIDTSIGTSIGQVVATDDDTGVYGNLLYHIEQGDFADSVFHISSTGIITLQQTLTSYSEGSILTFTIYAVDTGSKESSTNVSVVIPGTSVDASVIDNTIIYRTFFTYAPNMAWFVPLMFILFGTFCFVVHTIWTAVKCGSNSTQI